MTVFTDPTNGETITGTIDAGNIGDAGNVGVYKIVDASGNALIDGLLSGVAWRFTNFSVAYPTSAFCQIALIRALP